MATNGEKRAEIYTYEAPWMIYAANWSVREDGGDANARSRMKTGRGTTSGERERNEDGTDE